MKHSSKDQFTLSQDKADQVLLNTYYQAIQAIGTQYQQMIDSQENLNFHESKLKQVNHLADEFGISDISNLSINQNSNYTDTNLNIDQALVNAYNFLEHGKAIKQNKDNTLADLQQIKNNSLKNLKEPEVYIVNALRDIERDLENLKTQRMVYIIFGVVIGVGTTIIWQNLTVTFILTGLYFGISLGFE
ncbi:MAG: hypothetical protein F6K41_14695 [Symploca sp. SIO3E6]|nr:hypothetical protein [Caldora sp. SIO3E6]